MKIKYRVWCKNKNEWEKDITFINGDGFQYQYKNAVLVPAKDETHIVCMFTGLLDKNGKEIYKGDILKYTGSNCPYCGVTNKKYVNDRRLYQIEWKDCAFQCLEINGDNYMDESIWDKDMEVIGNVYENPGLLKEMGL